MRGVLGDVEERRVPGALIVARAAYCQALIDQCFMWCQAKGLVPRETADRWFVEQAVSDYKGTFAELIPGQRQIIAGLAEYD